MAAALSACAAKTLGVVTILPFASTFKEYTGAPNTVAAVPVAATSSVFVNPSGLPAA